MTSLRDFMMLLITLYRILKGNTNTNTNTNHYNTNGDTNNNDYNTNDYNDYNTNDYNDYNTNDDTTNYSGKKFIYISDDEDSKLRL